MTIEKIDTLVVGAGQAGIAISEHLSNNNVPHLILERDRIAERWRTQRWDSLVANGPAWHDRFPGLKFTDIDQDAFVPKEKVADYFVAYAEKISAPIRCGVKVTEVKRNTGRPGFRVKTSEGTIEANNVVAATGPFQKPAIPPIVPDKTDILQYHSSEYKNPEQLPDGAVLVIGAGSSGVQIADELLCSGKRVYLSVGPHDRPPRSYRGRDLVWWLGVLGIWDLEAMAPGMEHVTIAISGANGGKNIDFRSLAKQGMILLGRANTFKDGKMHFAQDLNDNLDQGDIYFRSIMDQADAYAKRNGLNLPQNPEARNVGQNSACITKPILNLELARSNINSIIWATGFVHDYSWLKVDALDKCGKPKHQRGVSSEPGVYFLGLPWQSRRGSSFIWGVWHDAKHVADHIAIQRAYLDYHKSAE